MENVKGLVTVHGEVSEDILAFFKQLKTFGGENDYSVFWKVIDSLAYSGIPQRRDRVYVIAIRKYGRERVKFTWPDPVPPKPLSIVFDRGSERLASYNNYPLPHATRKTCHARVCDALMKLEGIAHADGRRVESIDAVVDTEGSNLNMGVGYSPCVTKPTASNRDMWSMPHGRVWRIQSWGRMDQCHSSQKGSIGW